MSELSGNSNTPSEHYSLTAIALHWLMALLIIGLLLLGYYMVGLPKGTPNRADYFNLHKSFGVLAGILILLRVYWRFTHPVQPIQSAPPPLGRHAGNMDSTPVVCLHDPATGNRLFVIVF